MKKLMLSPYLVFIGGILSLSFAIMTFTTKDEGEHRLLQFNEEVLLQITGSTRVDLVCNQSKFERASAWNETFKMGNELTFSDLVQRDYPESLLNRLDESCAAEFNDRTTDRVIYGVLAILMAVYFVWGFRTYMKVS